MVAFTTNGMQSHDQPRKPPTRCDIRQEKEPIRVQSRNSEYTSFHASLESPNRTSGVFISLHDMPPCTPPYFRQSPLYKIKIKSHTNTSSKLLPLLPNYRGPTERLHSLPPSLPPSPFTLATASGLPLGAGFYLLCLLQ